jgi:hypothetical protein
VEFPPHGWPKSSHILSIARTELVAEPERSKRPGSIRPGVDIESDFDVAIGCEPQHVAIK